MNERINELRCDAGIYQLEDDLRLAVIDGEFNMIDPLIGLEKFAELVRQDEREACLVVLETYPTVVEMINAIRGRTE